METLADIRTGTQWVLLGAFALSAAFGAIVQRTRFCTMGAIADMVTMGSATRLRQWVLAVAVAVLGFGLLAAGGWIRAADSVYAGPRWMWLSSLVGGTLFGIGMVLASGCGSKTLVRMGAGNLKAWVVFVVMAVAAGATLRGITAVLRDSTVDRVFVEFPGPAILGRFLADAAAWPLPQAMGIMALLVAAPLLVWTLAAREFRTPENLLAGLGVGLVITALWWLDGSLGYVAEHPETLEPAYLGSRTGRLESLTFTAPLAYTLDWLMTFSDRSQRLSIAIVSVLGVVVGAALAAWARGEFRWEGFKTTEDLANHMIGGMLMGVGGVTALGCTIGQGLSGLSNLSLTSFTAVAGIVGGAVLALRYQGWRLARLA